MSKIKISSQEIVDLIAAKSSVSKRAAEEFFKALFLTIEDALIAGEAVKIKNFGTFKLQWNAERKSVNVNTGEDIVLPGYHKVTFTPDAELKALVNEPFSHLEPIVLDDNAQSLPSDSDVKTIDEEELEEPALDPLRIFEEQATEIKGIISEIQAMSSKRRKAAGSKLVAEPLPIEEIVVEQAPKVEVQEQLLPEPEVIAEEETVEELLVVEIPVEVNVEEEFEPQIDEPVIESVEEPVLVQTSVVEVPEIIAETKSTDEVVEEEYVPNDFLTGVETPKRRKIGWWILGVILLISVVKITLYFTYPPFTQLVDQTLISWNIGWKQEKPVPIPKPAPKPVVVDSVKDTVVTSVSDSDMHKEPVERKFVKTTVVVPDVKSQQELKSTEKKVSKTLEKSLADSLQILFNRPRVYPSYIATQRITEGSRLTIMAKRYYGASEFWVYIYEANKDRIKHPDHIASGTQIYIPKINPILVNPSNPKCIELAKSLHDKYVYPK